MGQGGGPNSPVKGPEDVASSSAAVGWKQGLPESRGHPATRREGFSPS